MTGWCLCCWVGWGHPGKGFGGKVCSGVSGGVIVWVAGVVHVCWWWMWGRFREVSVVVCGAWLCLVDIFAW